MRRIDVLRLAQADPLSSVKRRLLQTALASTRETCTAIQPRNDPPLLTWCRAGDLDPDLAGHPDHFIALDGEAEVGVVRERSDEGSWIWSILLIHPGLRFNRLTHRARRRERKPQPSCWSATRLPGVVRDRRAEA